ncbi:MAG: SusC/RagA family TonB-linked outer membrane protein [Bacteroidota bacterium]
MMRKTLLLLFLMVGFILTYAQEQTVTGVVTAASDGAPLPGVTVSLKGTTQGTTTDVDGKYAITLQEGDHTLVFSFIGMTTQEVAVGSQTTINVALETSTEDIEEVVVTALGISREKKALGYSVQQVSSDEITNSGRPDVIQSMQGKVAGVDIISAGGAGGSTRITIRGSNSLDPNADNQPLFVVDGIPISNSTISGNILPSAGSNASGSSMQFGFSNRAMDLNPNDIESMSVLKGAAATALYGARAANGAIIITTKSGKAGKTVVKINSKVIFDDVAIFPEEQTTWGRGLYSDINVLEEEPKEPSGNFGTFVEWGYKRDAIGETYYNNMEEFFQTGVTYDNSVSISGGSEKGNFYLSAATLDQGGIVPNTEWGRTSVKFSGSREISNKMKTSASVTYTKSGGRRGNHGDKSYMSSMLYWPNSLDMSIYQDENGAHVTHPYIDNPYYLINKTYLEDDVNRVLGYVDISYDILKNLTLSYRLGSDYYSDSRTYVVPYAEVPGEQPLDLASQNGGYIVEERINFSETNSDLILTFNKDITEDLKVTALLGNNVLISTYDRLNTRGEKWASPAFYDISNTTFKYSSNADVLKRMIGVYGNLRFEYKNYLFLGLTGRNDISSTLPVDSRSYFYPSVNLGFIVTDALNLESNLISYAKLRASYAKVAKDAPAHSLDRLYTSSTFGESATLTMDNSLGNSALKPEQTTSLEFGTDMQFFDKRLGVDFSWYKANTVDMLFRTPVAYTTGYSSVLNNIGELENKGIELLVTGEVLRGKDFNWDVTVNFSKNRTKVISLANDLEEIEIASGYAGIHQKLVVDGYYGDMYGYTYKQYYDANGNAQGAIINSDGRPTIDWDNPVFYGNVNPDWSGGINNTLSYKGLSFSFLIETKQGHIMSNEHVRNLIRQGKHISTEHRPTASEEGVILDGINVDDDGNLIGENVNRIQHYRNFYRYRDADNAATVIEDASWIRLRTLNLTYNLPGDLISKTNLLSGASISFIGSNLWVLTDFSGFDPEISKFGAGSNAQGYTGYSTPNTRQIGFSVNLTF